MNKSIKKKWLEALRSGDYKQGQGMLKTADGGFCCLGVLSDLYLKEMKLGWGVDDFDDTGFAADFAYLPVKVMAWAGMKERVANPIVQTPRGESSLGNLNDGDRYSKGENFTTYSGPWNFKKIANVIEKQL